MPSSTPRRRRRQQLRIAALGMIIWGLHLFTNHSPWAPFPTFLGSVLLAHSLRPAR